MFDINVRMQYAFQYECRGRNFRKDKETNIFSASRVTKPLFPLEVLLLWNNEVSICIR